jgi:hypothetical protein
VSNPPQILEAFDEHWEKFQWRLGSLKDAVEAAAYRQLVGLLTAELNQARHLNKKYLHVFKALDVDPTRHKAWAEKMDD